MRLTRRGGDRLRAALAVRAASLACIACVLLATPAALAAAGSAPAPAPVAAGQAASAGQVAPPQAAAQDTAGTTAGPTAVTPPGTPAGDAEPAFSGFGQPLEFMDLDHDVQGTVLTFRNREIAPMRVAVLGRTPAERADGASRALDRLVEERVIEPIETRLIPGGMLVFVGGEGVFGLTEADLADWAHVPVAECIARVERNLGLALAEALEATSPRRLVFGLLWAAVATALMVLVLRGLMLLNSRFAVQMVRHARAEARRLEGGAHDASSFGAHWLRTALLRLGRLATFAAGLLVLWSWLTFTLLQFPYLRPIGESLDGNLKQLVLLALASMAAAIPDLIVAVLILLAMRFVVRGANSFFQAVHAGRVTVAWISRDVAKPTRKLVSLALWIFAVVLAYPYLPGSDTQAFKGVTVFLGLLFSLGATGMVGQALAGLMLMYSNILRVGDYVRIGTSEGTVTQVNLLSTRLRTVFAEDLVIPNSVVMGQTTQNFSSHGERGGVRVTSDVTIGYDVPWRQVHALLKRAAATTPGLRATPEPEVLQIELLDFSVRYRVTACVEVPDDRIPVLSALHRNIQDQFNEHGVQIMSPHMIHHPTASVGVPKERWRPPPADPAAP